MTRSKKGLRAFFFGLLFVVSTAFSAVMLQRGLLKTHELDTGFLAPPKSMKYFTLGYGDLQASSLWLRLAQDFDYCKNGRFSAEDAAPLLDIPDKTKAILERELKPSKCNLGWVFHMLDYMSEVQPNFEIIYTVGGPLLSVLVDDREGARQIFDKGVALYPEDWQLNFQAGYHYLWELRDVQRAAELLNQAQQHGAPDWVSALSANLYSRIGQAVYAKTILIDTLKRTTDPTSRARILNRLKKVEDVLKKSADSDDE